MLRCNMTHTSPTPPIPATACLPTACMVLPACYCLSGLTGLWVIYGYMTQYACNPLPSPPGSVPAPPLPSPPLQVACQHLMMAAGVGDPLKCKDLGIMALISSCNAAVGESKLRQAQVQGCSGRHGVAGVAIAGACPRACTHTHTPRVHTQTHTQACTEAHPHMRVCVCAHANQSPSETYG